MQVPNTAHHRILLWILLATLSLIACSPSQKTAKSRSTHRDTVYVAMAPADLEALKQQLLEELKREPQVSSPEPKPAKSPAIERSSFHLPDAEAQGYQYASKFLGNFVYTENGLPVAESPTIITLTRIFKSDKPDSYVDYAQLIFASAHPGLQIVPSSIMEFTRDSLKGVELYGLQDTSDLASPGAYQMLWFGPQSYYSVECKAKSSLMDALPKFQVLARGLAFRNPPAKN